MLLFACEEERYVDVVVRARERDDDGITGGQRCRHDVPAVALRGCVRLIVSCVVSLFVPSGVNTCTSENRTRSFTMSKVSAANPSNTLPTIFCWTLVDGVLVWLCTLTGCGAACCTCTPRFA
jgi:hypothetical protein